jgi:DNA polymerase III epsilon subunit-like protein
MSIFLDIETSGLSPTQGAVILSIGMIHDESQLESPASEFEIYITPTTEEWAQASDQALAVNGQSYEFLCAHGVPLKDAVDQVCKWLEERRVWLGTEVIGQNPDFDFRFLNYFMGMNLLNTGFPANRNPTDVIALAKELVERDEKFRPISETGRISFKGSNISKALGLPPEPEIHTALAGARACRQNYYGVQERLAKTKRAIKFR